MGYGLGSECQDLPGFVVLNGGLIPPGGLDNFGSGFLPATYQGSVFKHGAAAGGQHRAQLKPAPSCSATSWRWSSSSIGDALAERVGRHDQLESAIANYELAFRMQTAVPELMDLSRRDRSHEATVRHGGGIRTDAQLRPGSACLLGGWSSEACGSSS